MSLIRKCDICKKEIEFGEDYQRVIPGNDNDEAFDICPSCWTILIHDIRAKQQRREESKEAEKMFSDPWDNSGIMAFKNGERMC